MDKRVIETSLKNWWRKEGIQKVLSIEPESAVGKDQNFLSTIRRLRMKVVLGNGRVANRTAILKLSELDCGEENLLKDLGIFKTEIKIYITVLQEMENLMDEFNSTEDVLWCKLLHYEPYSSIILEDLGRLGYKTHQIPCYLDIDHALLVLRSLGLFHGMSKVLEERGIINEKDFSPWYVFSGTPNRIWRSYLQELVTVIKENWNPRWKPIAEKLQRLTVKNIEDRIQELQKSSDSGFKVLNHGDPIAPNIMFKYDWKNRPVSTRFIDFQLAAYGTPCYDLTYFMYRTLKASVRRENFQRMMECYHDSLLSTLNMFNYNGRRPTLEELVEEMERLSFLGSILFLVNYVPIVANQDEFGHAMHKDLIFGVYRRQDSEQELGPGVQHLVEKHLSFTDIKV